MAEVYLAYDRRVRRQVATKVLYGRDESFVRRFEREALAVGALSHDHILPLYDFGEQRPWYYLVMPYVEGGTLRDYLHDKKRLALDEAASFVDQIAAALQYAHDHTVIHREVKPSNILLRPDAYAYLVDFGLAKAMMGAEALTSVGAMVGTPEYMAPEQSNGVNDYRSDIYSLGIILYQMLTGRVPFTAESPVAVSLKHIQIEPTPPSQLNNAIPQSVEEVILKALSKDPNDRYQQAQALSTAYWKALHRERLWTTGKLVTPSLTDETGAEEISESQQQNMTDTSKNEAVHEDETGEKSAEHREAEEHKAFYIPYKPTHNLQWAGKQGKPGNHPYPYPPHPQYTRQGCPYYIRNWMRQPYIVGTPLAGVLRSRAGLAGVLGKGTLLALLCLILIVMVVPLGLGFQASRVTKIKPTQGAGQQATRQWEREGTATANAQAFAQAQIQATLAAQARVQATAGITSSIGAGQALYGTDLTSPGGGWIDDGYQCYFSPQGYHVQTHLAHAAAWCYSNQQQFSNAVITAQAQLLRGDTYGLIFRLSPASREFYVLELNKQGEYRFVQAYGNDPFNWLTLIDWTHSNAIQSGYGHTNTFLILANGPHFRFYINKQLIVNNFTDSLYSNGLIGFLVAGDSSAGTEAVFSNVWVFQK